MATAHLANHVLRAQHRAAAAPLVKWMAGRLGRPAGRLAAQTAGVKALGPSHGPKGRHRFTGGLDTCGPCTRSSGSSPLPPKRCRMQLATLA